MISKSWTSPRSPSGTRVLHFQPPTELKNEVLVALKQNCQTLNIFLSKPVLVLPINDKDMSLLTRFSGLKFKKIFDISISLHQVYNQLVNAVEVKTMGGSICMQ